MQKKLLQNFETPRKRLSLILKLNHMLYKHDIEDRSDIIVGKSSFAFHTKHTQLKQQSQIYFIHER